VSERSTPSASARAFCAAWRGHFDLRQALEAFGLEAPI
jgi:hypothetical protein